MKEYLYKNGSNDVYAASIASTWIWAPALFISSSIAYFNGIYGFLWFLIPNVLTLVVFGYFTQKFIPEEGFTVGSFFEDLPYQQKIHSIVSLILLVCSTCVQYIALNTIVNMFFDVNIYITTLVAGLICYVYTYYGGIKFCIQSDGWKYVVLLVCSVGLLFSCSTKEMIMNIHWTGLNHPTFKHISLTFGIITAIGLMCAPYVDNTFWQRVYSVKKENRFFVYFHSAIMFAIIPMVFGFLGFVATGCCQLPDWNITQMFHNLSSKIIFLIAALSTLVATVDSNMCAIEPLMDKDFRCHNNILPIPIFLIGVPLLIIYLFNPSIIDLFLVYGTIRTALAIPTLLKMTNNYNKYRLFIGTLCGIAIGGIGYAWCSFMDYDDYRWIATLLALLLPLIGYQKSLNIRS